VDPPETVTCSRLWSVDAAVLHGPLRIGYFDRWYQPPDVYNSSSGRIIRGTMCGLYVSTLNNPGGKILVPIVTGPQKMQEKIVFEMQLTSKFAA
jgi:hypothetical protein